MDTEKICTHCGKHCVDAQSYCPQCGNKLPAATAVNQGPAPASHSHQLIIGKDADERFIKCKDEKQAFDRAQDWLLEGYVVRIADEHGVVKWTLVPSDGQIVTYKDDVTARSASGGQLASQPTTRVRKPWWRFW